MKWGEIKEEILFCRSFFMAASEAQRLQNKASLERFREVLRKAPPGIDLSEMRDTFEDIVVSSLRDGDRLTEYYGVNVLHRLCVEGLGIALKGLLEESETLRASLNKQVCGGLSALDYAFEANNPEMAEILMDAGAKPSEKGMEAMVYGGYRSWKDPAATFKWAAPMLVERGLLENAPGCFMAALSKMEKRELNSGIKKGSKALQAGKAGRM